MGNPAVNAALIPFAKKNAYNAASPLDDAKGTFASDIVASLNAFGTDPAHQAILAGVAITNGDYIRAGPDDPEFRGRRRGQPRGRLPQRPPAEGRHDRHHPHGDQQRHDARR